MVKMLCQQRHLNINHKNKVQQSAITIAAQRNEMVIFKLLIDHNAMVDKHLVSLIFQNYSSTPVLANGYLNLIENHLQDKPYGDRHEDLEEVRLFLYDRRREMYSFFREKNDKKYQIE